MKYTDKKATKMDSTQEGEKIRKGEVDSEISLAVINVEWTLSTELGMKKKQRFNDSSKTNYCSFDKERGTKFQVFKVWKRTQSLLLL